MHIQCIELLPLYNPRETETTVSSTNFFSGYSWWTNIFFPQTMISRFNLFSSSLSLSLSDRGSLWFVLWQISEHLQPSVHDEPCDIQEQGFVVQFVLHPQLNKGNNKITEQSYKGSQNSYVYRQTKSVNNQKTENRNDPELVQEFLKKWWVESDFKAPNLPLSLRLKVFGCHNTWTKQVKQLSKQHQTQWSKCQRHFYVTHW